MDLTVIYSKTSIRSRQRSTLFGGLSLHMKKVLALVDGKSDVRQILAQLNGVSAQKLIKELAQLEEDGYIKQVKQTVSEDWLKVSVFSPMVVEEFGHIDEVEAKAERDLQLESEQKARVQMEDELQTRKVVEQIRAKEKARAEDKSRINTERKAKQQAELQQAEQKVKAEVEQRARVEAEVKVKARTVEMVRIEKARIALEQEELRKKAEAEAQALIQEKNKQEAEARHQAVLSVLKALEDAEQNRMKLEAEDKARAEELMRIQAERLAREQEELRKRVEAEAHAQAEEAKRIEKERVAREQEDLQKIAEAEALAKAEEKSRLDAERKAKRQVDALQKAELKAREALERVRAKEQALARATEQEARKKVEEKKRLEAERIAQQEAEARLKMEAEAREEAEKTRAQADAEEKTKAEALKRVEIERKEHKAAEMLKKVEAEARAKVEEEVRREEERIAKEKAVAEAKLNAQIKSQMKVQKKTEEKARKEAERIAKKEEKAALAKQSKIKQEASQQKRAGAQRLVAEVRQEKPKIQAIAKLLAIALVVKKQLPVVVKKVLAYLTLMILVLVGALHFINLSMLIIPIQQLASESIGEQVLIQEVHASLWPAPHLTLDDVTVGTSSSLKNGALEIKSVFISPNISTLFENVKVIDSLEFSGVNLEQIVAGKALQWVSRASNAERLKIKQINFSQVNLKILDLSLSPFQGEILLGEAGKLASINMSSPDQGLSSIQLLPQGDGFHVMLTAMHWPLPFNQKIVFEELKVKGTFSSNQVNFSQIGGGIYGGNLTASAIVNWSKQWVVAGKFSLIKANTSQLLQAFASGGDVEGKLNFTGNVAGTSDTAEKLANETEVNANFEVRSGKINGIDLERAVLSSGDKSLTGDATDFNKLSGLLKAKGGRFQFGRLVLQAPQLQAQGNLDIQPKQDVSGNIDASLVAQSRRLQARFSLTGKINNVKQR